MSENESADGTVGAWNITFLRPDYPTRFTRWRTRDSAYVPGQDDAGKIIEMLGHKETHAIAEDAARQMLDRTKPAFPYEYVDDLQISFQVDALVKGLIDRKTLTVLYGKPGCGKSTFAVDLVQRIARGIQWRGRKVNPGLVIYVAGEAPESIKRRLKAWSETNIGDIQDGVTPIVLVKRAPNMPDPGDVDKFIEQVRVLKLGFAQQLVLFVFDTLSRCLPGGDENSAQDMTMAIAVADRLRDEFGASTLFLHHMGKDVTKGARGSSTLNAAADCMISIVDGVARIEKSRDDLVRGQFPFEIDSADLGVDSDGDALTSAVLRHTDEAPASRKSQPKLSGVAKTALMALQEAVGDHGQLMPGTSSIPAGARAVTIGQWRDRFRLRYGSDPDGGQRGSDAIKKAFNRGREQLAEANAVMISDPYAWVTQ